MSHNKLIVKQRVPKNRHKKQTQKKQPAHSINEAKDQLNNNLRKI
jgi:hypothetical protein